MKELFDTAFMIGGICTGTKLSNATECMEYMIQNQCEDVVIGILKNPYSTAEYKNNLLKYSEYHIPAISTYSTIQMMGACNKSIAIKEKETTIVEAILPIKLKECTRWEDNTALGLMGIYGGWNNG